MNQLEIRTMPLSELKPAPYNPRRPVKKGDPGWKKLEASLREFGLVEPLVWNETTGCVVGGHLRLQILGSLGATEAPLSVVPLSEARERALNIVLNNREAQGRFDVGRLTELLTELEGLPEMELTGFDADDRAALRLEPVGDTAAEEPGGVEVTLTTDADTYARLAPRLDELVREFDLVTHVRTT
jgi:ParB-like chromosome segregation protein Spo0J